MLKAGLIFLIIIFLGLTSFSVIKLNKKHYYHSVPANHPPDVKIVHPDSNSVYQWNTRIPYSIKVSDVEDGESKYQEISPKEVFLSIKYYEDIAAAKEIMQQDENKQSGITAMEASNCFNCHALKSQLIGPSFKQISKKYKHALTDEKHLAAHIINGSKGIWGDAAMPSHTELSEQKTEKMAKWVFDNAANPGYNLYVGLSGSFNFDVPDTTTHQGVFLLTASYTDHGLKNKPGQRLTGRDMLIIKGE